MEITLTQLVQLISQVGFPIGVAVYSLVVLNRTVNKHTEVLTKVAAKMDVDVSFYDGESKTG